MKKLCLLPLLFVGVSLSAQTRPAVKPPAKPAAQPVKGPAPKIKASVGGREGGTVDLTLARVIVDFPLVLKDDKGNVYPIKQCSFVYKRKNIIEEEETGRKIIKWEHLVKDLRNNEQLDEFWRTEVKASLSSGEEFYFQRILADSQKGYVVPVTGIHFVVK